MEADLAGGTAFSKALPRLRPGCFMSSILSNVKTFLPIGKLPRCWDTRPDEGGDFDQIAMRLFHPDDLSALRLHHEALRRARSGDVQRIEYRARHADGNWVWLSAWETPFTWDADGRVRQVVGRRAGCDRAQRRARAAYMAGQLRYPDASGESPAFLDPAAKSAAPRQHGAYAGLAVPVRYRSVQGH